MSDQYERIRALPFPTLAGLLGLDLGNFKQRKHGQEFYGPCPIHNPKQNSTSFSYAADGKFFCFSCNAKGRGAIDLAKLVKDLGFQDAVKWLQPSCSAEATQTPPKKEKNALEAISGSLDGKLKPLEKDTWRKFPVPCPWLEARCPDAGVRERYGVFCYNNPARKSAYSGRVMLPVKDVEGLLFGYLGRLVPASPVLPPQQNGQHQEQPKYLFPNNLPKSRFLFGAHELGTFGQLPLRVCYLVESPFSVLHFASLNLPCVAAFGWSVSTEQTELLQTLARGVVYLPDGNKRDSAHQVAAHLSARFWLRFPPLPADIQDPEQMTREQILAL